MNFNKYHVSKNLFDDFDIVGQVPSVSNGNLVNSTLGGTTSFIKMDSVEIVLSYNVIANIYLFLYNNDFQFIGYVQKINGEPIYSTSITGCSNAAYCRVRLDNLSDFSNANIMLNLGSTALPYEPYSSEVWRDTPHYIMGTSTDTLTTLPAVIYANDTTATVGLKGNMSQSSQPSPQTPIQPQETGERTGNLVEEVLMSCNIQADGTLIGNPSFTMFIAKIKQGQTYSLDSVFVGGFFASKPTIGAIAYNNTREVTNRTYFIAPIDGYVVFRKSSTETTAMLNTGSTPLPYEPYGYKIPILSANTTTPIYLGEVETTRKVKKLVLTGEERDWVNAAAITATNAYQNATVIIGYKRETFYCSHMVATTDSASATTHGYIGQRLTLCMDKTLGLDTVDKFKTYLQQQYAAGTPVTVWYVLATEETAVVNEPLMKIGDYADTVSGITIPTIAGANTIDIDTTLKPSEVTVNYHGWHPVSAVHERESGAWT